MSREYTYKHGQRKGQSEKRHVPYRDSKLTRLAKGGLGDGPDRSVLLMPLSAAPDAYDATRAMLELMQRIASSHAHEGEGADAGGAVTDRVAKAVLNPGHETERRKRAVALLARAAGWAEGSVPRNAKETEAELQSAGVAAGESLVQLHERMLELELLRPTVLELAWQKANDAARIS